MLTALKILASYLPHLLTHRIAADPQRITAPVMERLETVALFADISGFTRLTERLSQEGPEGAEELSRLLNAYFGQLIDLIHKHGGDVVKFAGDALLANWPVTETLPLTLGALAAAQCALAMQATMRSFDARGARLSLRIGVGTGELSVEHLGGEFGLWQLLITGEALTQLNQAEHQAQPGQVVVSPQVWEAIRASSVGETLPEGGTRLTQITTPITPTPLPLTAPTLAMDEALRSYLPGAILSRVAAGQTAWLAELRLVTVLFVHLPELNHQTPLDLAQTAIRTLQQTLYHYEGSVDKLNVDQKGVALVAALGLPPLAHEDDATRGVQAALAMQAELRKLGWSSSIGITTGRAFCGSIGNEQRREYTMMGDVVNLAARLMQAANGKILCDAATYQSAQEDLAFTSLPPIMVKGKAEPVVVYQPQSTQQRGELVGSLKMRGAQTPIVGRKAERMILSEQLQVLLRGRTGGEIVIEGEAGIGKSRLVEELLQLAAASGIESLVGAADAVEKLTPYYAWRAVFSQALSIDADNDSEAQRQAALERIGLTPIWLWTRLSPLLNAVLPLELPDNDVTLQMTGQVRADNIRDLLLQILQAVAQTPRLLVLEDTHWLDSASWALVNQVSQRIKTILLVVATRPLGDNLPLEYAQLLNAPTTKRLRLEMLAPDEAVTLVCQRLGITLLPEPVAALIREKAEGNPFFSEELAYALRDAGLIRIVGNECRLTTNASSLNELRFPDTVQGVITSRIDRLQPAQQLTLKVASVIGRTFPFRTLHDVYPVEPDRGNLPSYIKDLAQLDLTPLDVPEPNLTYIFKHIITQEVAYNLMLYQQRRNLHQAIAEWFERTYPHDLSAHYQLLAYHWREAEVIDKAVNYLEQAGEQAMRNHASAEAIEFFSQALALDLENSQPSSEQRRAHWEMQRGAAYTSNTNYRDGRLHLEAGLAFLGEQVPRTTSAQVGGLLKQLLRQIGHRFWPSRYIGRNKDQAEWLLERSRAYESLAEIYYFANEILLSLYAVLRSLNSAELAGPSPQLARAYAPFGAVLGFIPIHPLAEAYCKRALDGVEQSDSLSAKAWVFLTTGLYFAGVGQWQKTRQLFEGSIEISARLGDRRRRDDANSNLAAIKYLCGEFATCLKNSDDLYATAGQRGDAGLQTWALRNKTYCLFPFDQAPEALECLTQIQSLMNDKKVVDEALKIDLPGLFALAYVRQKQFDEALKHAETALKLIMTATPSLYVSLPGYVGVAEAYLTLWEQSQSAPQANLDPVALKKSAAQACQGVQKFAGIFSIGQPRALLLQGRYEWLNHNRDKARKLWRQSLVAAQKLNMPYDIALAQYEVGRSSPAGADRQRYLAEAQNSLTQLGATYELKLVQLALTEAAPR